ncbi:MAG: prepilin-type N-terminal cleavage/methylation domain-containing protein [Lachnospiraceae bacterium]|nr:prepilin-type N-terminal cleavage/methylation domain-containing protein [Lachnospiraceae bacterium]
MKKTGNKGFTLVEMMVVLVIIVILLGVSAWGVTGWIRHTEFVKNNENAQSIYYGAQSAFSYMESQGILDEYLKNSIKPAATQIADKSVYGLPVEKDNSFIDHDYSYITVSKGAYSSGVSSELFDLVAPYIFDAEVLNGSICIEFDTTSKKVYSVFYGSWTEGFEYAQAENDDRLGIYSINKDSRAEAERSPLAVGYYAMDQVNKTALDAVKLKLSSRPALVNDETLYLRFSSNSRLQEQDTAYTISFYDKSDDVKLFTISFSPVSDGLFGQTEKRKVLNLKTEMAVLPSGKSLPGALTQGNTYTLPYIIDYSGGMFVIELDSMMDAASYAMIENGMLQKNTGLSITRILGNKPVDLYAKVGVEPLPAAAVAREYTVEEPKKTNVENDLFATGNGGAKVCLSKSRHISNIRYHHEDTSGYEMSGDIDWKDNIVYSLKNAAVNADPEDADKTVFPSVPIFPGGMVFDGNGKVLANYRISEQSAKHYGDVSGLSEGESAKNIARYAGLFSVNEGSIKEVYIDACSLKIGESAVNLAGAGMIAGLNRGSLKQLAFSDKCKAEGTLTYDEDLINTLAGEYPEGSSAVCPKAMGFGMVCGVTESDASSVTDRILTAGRVDGKVVYAGSKKPFTYDTIETDGYIPVGIGGVTGYALMADNAVIGVKAGETEAVSIGMGNYLKSVGSRSVKNGAVVTGNMFTGGIAGNIKADGSPSHADGAHMHVINCENAAYTGIVDRLTNASEPLFSGQEARYGISDMEKEDPLYRSHEGLYIGGITGFAYGVQIADCSFSMNETAARERLSIYTTGNGKTGAGRKALDYDSRGVFVGGIAGFAYDGYMTGCSTVKGGYITGFDNVGGILGSSKVPAGVSVVTVNSSDNASYVLGNNCIGGITGMNCRGSIINACRSGAAVAGSGVNIGGIAGKNSGIPDTTGSKDVSCLAVIRNCGANINDYGQVMYKRVKDTWAYEGSNVGGQIGLNEYGRIEFNSTEMESSAIATLAVGKNNVGGFVGYNGINGEIELKGDGTEKEYVAGNVYGRGDFVGGFVGLNLAPEILSGQSIRISTTSVEGRYAVGGVIGGNILQMKSDAVMDIKYSNRSSAVSGKSLVGGIAGFQALTEGSGSLPASGTKEGYTAIGDDGWYMNIMQRNADGIWKMNYSKLGNASAYILTIGGSTEGEFNNGEVRAVTFGGGLIGADDEDSRVIIKNAINSGRVTELAETADAAKMDLTGYVGVETTAKNGLIGGIIGHNPHATVVESCANKGVIETLNDGFGGIAGLNEGLIINSRNEASIGNSRRNIAGGIAGVNFGSADEKDLRQTGTYKYYAGTIKGCINDRSVTVAGADRIGGIAGMNIRGIKNGSSGKGGILTACRAYGIIAGDEEVGGLAGRNHGVVESGGAFYLQYSLSVQGRNEAGGLIGRNDKGGSIEAVTENHTGAEAINVKASGSYAGGLVGYLADGEIKGSESLTLKSYAVVNAVSYAGGIAGGMEGGKKISLVENYGPVTASSAAARGGYAGGIVPLVTKESEIEDSIDHGKVTATLGYAGGICARNAGLLLECSVDEKNGTVPVITLNASSGGIVASINDPSGIIRLCSAGTDSDEKVVIQGDHLTSLGYIVGLNEGRLEGGTTGKDVSYSGGSTEFALGGAVGENRGKDAVITLYEKSGSDSKDLKVEVNFDSKSVLKDVKYLGGIVGDNNGGLVRQVYYEGVIKDELDSRNEKTRSYGGIAGVNRSHDGSDGTIDRCSLDGGRISAVGYYEDGKGQNKISMKLGGICGHNESGGVIKNCAILKQGSSQAYVELGKGLAGGIAGLNEGVLSFCGYGTDLGMSAKQLGEKEDGPIKRSISRYVYDSLNSSRSDAVNATSGNCAEQMLSQKYIDDQIYGKRDEDAYYTGVDIMNEELSYTNTESVFYALRDYITVDENNDVTVLEKDKFDAQIRMSAEGFGHLGGIAGCNGSKGSVVGCASGKWYICSNITDISATVGGIIGQNESEKVVAYNVNCAYVRRNVDEEGNEGSLTVNNYINTGSNSKGGKSLYFVGGVIGSQYNESDTGWRVHGCVNIGDVVDNHSHNVGGIIAKWNSNGGIIDNCFNYGTLRTNFQQEGHGTVGGIISSISGIKSGQSVNVLSCQNHGRINHRVNHNIDPAIDTGTTGWAIANETAGIVSEIYTRESNEVYYVNVVDCVNGYEADAIAYSKANGIVSYAGGPDPSKDSVNGANADNLILNINYCRNYCTDFFVTAQNTSIKPAKTGGILGNRITYSKKLLNGELVAYGKSGVNTGTLVDWSGDNTTDWGAVAGCGGYTVMQNCFSVIEFTGDQDRGGLCWCNNDPFWGSKGRSMRTEMCYGNYYMVASSFTRDRNARGIMAALSTPTGSTGNYPNVYDYDTMKAGDTGVLDRQINAHRLVAGQAAGSEYGDYFISSYDLGNNNMYQKESDFVKNPFLWVKDEKTLGVRTKKNNVITEMEEPILLWFNENEKEADLSVYQKRESDSIPGAEDITDPDMRRFFASIADERMADSYVTDLKVEYSARDEEYVASWQPIGVDGLAYYVMNVDVYKIPTADVKAQALTEDGITTEWIRQQGGESIHSYTENVYNCDAILDLPAVVSDETTTYYVVVNVRGRSINGTMSLPAEGFSDIVGYLPKPDIEIVRFDADDDGEYEWCAHLINADEYAAFYNADPAKNWKVTVLIDKLYDGINDVTAPEIVIEGKDPSETAFDAYIAALPHHNAKLDANGVMVRTANNNSSEGTWVMTATAKASCEGFDDSAEFSESMALPAWSSQDNNRIWHDAYTKEGRIEQTDADIKLDEDGNIDFNATMRAAVWSYNGSGRYGYEMFRTEIYAVKNSDGGTYTLASKDTLFFGNNSAVTVKLNTADSVSGINPSDYHDYRVVTWFCGYGTDCPVNTYISCSKNEAWSDGKPKDRSTGFVTDLTSGEEVCYYSPVVKELGAIADLSPADRLSQTAENVSGSGTYYYFYYDKLAEKTRAVYYTKAKNNGNYRQILFNADMQTLSAVTLADKDKDGSALAAFTDDGEGEKLNYTVSWKAENDGDYSSYKLSVYGKTFDADGNLTAQADIGSYRINNAGEITVLEGQDASSSKDEDTGLYSLILGGDEWNYDAFTVRVEGETETAGSLASSDEHTWTGLKQRLDSLLKPDVRQISREELKYRLQWNASVQENEDGSAACAGYRVMLMDSNGDRTVLLDRIEDTFAVVDLEKYEGSAVNIFIIALATEDSTRWYDSLDGDMTEVTILSRLVKPVVSFAFSFGDEEALTETAFMDTANSLDALISDDDSSAGYNYPVYGIWFDSMDEAVAAAAGIADLEGSSQIAAVEEMLADPEASSFGAGGTITLTKGSEAYSVWIPGIASDWAYSYAGKVLLPFVRRAPGTGDNRAVSEYTVGSPLTVPKVRLDDVTVTEAVTDASANGALYSAEASTQTFDESTFDGNVSGYIPMTSYSFGRSDGYPDHYEITVAANTSEVSGGSVHSNAAQASVIISIKEENGSKIFRMTDAEGNELGSADVTEESATLAVPDMQNAIWGVVVINQGTESIRYLFKDLDLKIGCDPDGTFKLILPVAAGQFDFTDTETGTVYSSTSEDSDYNASISIKAVMEDESVFVSPPAVEIP